MNKGYLGKVSEEEKLKNESIISPNFGVGLRFKSKSKNA